MDQVFRALSDPKRREILRLLRSGDLAAGDLANHFPIARSTLSEHLGVLRGAGLVVTERQGIRIVYSLNVAVYEELLAVILGLLGVGQHDGREELRDEAGSPH